MNSLFYVQFPWQGRSQIFRFITRAHTTEICWRHFLYVNAGKTETMKNNSLKGAQHINHHDWWLGRQSRFISSNAKSFRHLIFVQLFSLFFFFIFYFFFFLFPFIFIITFSQSGSTLQPIPSTYPIQLKRTI